MLLMNTLEPLLRRDKTEKALRLASDLEIEGI
jgi:hypothetical protein